jgi:hypothetical protein
VLWYQQAPSFIGLHLSNCIVGIDHGGLNYSPSHHHCLKEILPSNEERTIGKSQHKDVNFNQDTLRKKALY